MSSLFDPPRGKHISVIIPALNEQESIGYVVASMPWSIIAECIVVDNGSTDSTAAVATAAGARVITSTRGYGAACKAGLEAALSSSSILEFMDGDGRDVITDLTRLAAPIESGEADFVIGSRLRGRRESGSMRPSQVFAGHLVSVLLRVLHGVRYTDMGPFRAIRRSSLQQLDMRERTYGWNLEMQVKAAKQHLRIQGIPVDYQCRKGGLSTVSGNVAASFKNGVRILIVLVRTSFSSSSFPSQELPSKLISKDIPVWRHIKSEHSSREALDSSALTLWTYSCVKAGRSASWTIWRRRHTRTANPNRSTRQQNFVWAMCRIMKRCALL